MQDRDLLQQISPPAMLGLPVRLRYLSKSGVGLHRVGVLGANGSERRHLLDRQRLSRDLDLRTALRQGPRRQVHPLGTRREVG